MQLGHDDHDHAHGARCHGHAAPSAATVKDPVCGMNVDPATSRHRHAHGGETYHFCNPRCLEKFKADPERYLGPPSAAVPPADSGAVYTCPMHPEVRQVGPGS